MSFETDRATLTTTLEGLDPQGLRSGPAALRAALGEVVRAGGALWAAPMPQLVHALVQTARVDLALARLVEGHADAVRILDQADERAQPGVYGVWASRSVGTGVVGRFREGRWSIEGELRFASGVGLIDRALVPVWVDGSGHQLLDLSLDEGTFTGDPDTWRTVAMDASQSWTVQVDTEAPITATVGPQDWYLARPGFVVGGLGVAAVWAGGAQLVLDLLVESGRRFAFSTGQLRRLGIVDQEAWQARTAVEHVAERLDQLTRNEAVLEVSRARTGAAEACERVIGEAGHIVGPGGLSRNERLVQALADLGIYVRQLALDPELEGRGRRLAHERRPL